MRESVWVGETQRERERERKGEKPVLKSNREIERKKKKYNRNSDVVNKKVYSILDR